MDSRATSNSFCPCWEEDQDAILDYHHHHHHHRANSNTLAAPRSPHLQTLIGNTLLPKFIKNALHVEEAEEVDAHPSIFMDPEVWLLVGLIAFALVVTQEKKGKEKEKEK